MRWMKSGLLIATAFAWLVPFAPLAFAEGLSARECTPLVITKERVKLFFEAAHAPIEKLAPQVYQLAADSERCRLASGAAACGLPEEPLKSTGLKQIFQYYVKRPTEEVMDHQQIVTHKSVWIWQPYVNQR